MIEDGAGVNRGSVGATIAGPVGRAVLKAALGQPTPKSVTPSYPRSPNYQPTATATYSTTVTQNNQGNNQGNGGTGTTGSGNGGTNTEGDDGE